MTKSKIGQVVSYIAILLVIVAVIGVFAYFTNGFTSDFKTFYVSVNGKDITVIRAKSDCGGQFIIIEDQYTNGERGEGQVQKPVEPDSTADIVNRVICKELNFGD